MVADTTGVLAQAVTRSRRRERNHLRRRGKASQHLRASPVCQLRRLAAALRIPPGFYLTSAAFEEWLACGTVGEIGEEASRLPQVLFGKLTHAYALLTEHCGVTDLPVAVRSSALEEDGIGSSFAGQHTTVLNVVRPEAIAAAVVHCWQLAFSTRVQAYRRHQGLGAAAREWRKSSSSGR